jgi:hypothetical protein
MMLGQVFISFHTNSNKVFICETNSYTKHTYSDEVYECNPGSARRTKKVLSSWAATRSFRHRIFPWIMPWSSCLKNYRLVLHASQLKKKYNSKLLHTATVSITHLKDDSSKPDSSQAFLYLNFTEIMKVRCDNEKQCKCTGKMLFWTLPIITNH